MLDEHVALHLLTFHISMPQDASAAPQIVLWSGAEQRLQELLILQSMMYDNGQLAFLLSSLIHCTCQRTGLAWTIAGSEEES